MTTSWPLLGSVEGGVEFRKQKDKNYRLGYRAQASINNLLIDILHKNQWKPVAAMDSMENTTKEI